MFTTRHGEGKARLPCELRTIVFDKSENSLGMDKFIPLHSVLRTGKDEPRGAPLPGLLRILVTRISVRMRMNAQWQQRLATRSCQADALRGSDSRAEKTDMTLAWLGEGGELLKTV